MRWSQKRILHYLSYVLLTVVLFGPFELACKDDEPDEPAKKTTSTAGEAVVEESLERIESTPARLREAAGDCVELARILKEMEQQSAAIGQHSFDDAPFEVRGDKATRELASSLDELEPVLIRCAEDPEFLRIMEERL